MQRILVTGGAGYIGSVLVPTVLAEGFEVTVIDNFMYKQASLLDVCNNPNLTIIRGDVRDKALLARLIMKADYILPLAAIVGAPRCNRDPVGAQTINYDAIKLILELRDKKQRIIFPTTNSGYGIGQADIFCTEETPLNPISFYGRLKAQAEAAVLDSKNAITLRLATVFGISPRMRLDLLVNDFTYRAINDGFIVLFEAHFKRNYIHVRDVAKAFIHCIRHFEIMKDEPYNVGLSTANLSKIELCEEIKKFVSSFYFVEAAVGEDPDKRNYLVSNAKIEKTGFLPDYDLSAGIGELIKGYQVIKRNQFVNE